jgi:hypothetical protein
LTGNLSLTCLPYFIINIGIGINKIATPARMVHPHPYPTAAYISPPNNGNVAPTIARKSAPAAIADAAYLVNASM